MKHALVLALCLASFSLLAQDKTYSGGFYPFELTDDQIYVLPCRPDMLICDLDRELERTEQRPLADIRETLRESMHDAVAEQCMTFATGHVHPPVAENRDGYQQLFGNASYQELPVPATQEHAGRMERIRALMEADEPEAGTRVERGEIKTYFGKGETFMQLVLRHDTALSTLHAQTQFDYLVCINEIDIRVLRKHEAEMGQSWDRRVKVHYTIFDPKGSVVAGGAAYSTYSGEEKGMETLIRVQFPKVAAQIAAEMVRLKEEVTPAQKAVPTPTKKLRRNNSGTRSDDDF